jgi:nucleoside-diphosphate-sugar epimerase
MKVLLTGYSGNLGRPTARALLDAGHQVRALLHSRGLDPSDARRGAEGVWGSLEEFGRFGAYTSGVDAVVHCAVELRREPAERFERRNLRAPVALFLAGAAGGVRAFVNVSSVMVYGLDVGPGLQPVAESAPRADPAAAIDRYPAAKARLEGALEECAADTGTALITVRPGLLYSDAVAPVLRLARAGGNRFGVLAGSGANHLPYIHVDDVADLIVRALAAGHSHAIYNATPTQRVPCGGFARAWAAAHDRELTIVAVPTPLLTAFALVPYAVKRAAGRAVVRPNVRYGCRRGTRDISYSSLHAVRTLGWADARTLAITSGLAGPAYEATAAGSTKTNRSSEV